jgi:sulfatase maturation enzyme AslB (radical SAM superfamily)
MKILCLGNNTELTDQMTSDLAESMNSVNHGLITELESQLDLDNIVINDGYYHTSVLDMSVGRINKLSKHFDQVTVLDQPVECWNHPDEFYATNNLALSLTCRVDWNNSDGKQQIEYWSNLVNDNSSFCIFPFIELLTNDNHTTVCCRSSTPIVNIKDLENFSTDKNYSIIRKKMIEGQKLPLHCNFCYNLESQGIKSARQQETVEWAIRLNLYSTDDLSKITKPVYYEVRPSNVCNIMCRICSPQFSNKIQREWKTLGWIDSDKDIAYSNFEIVDTTDIKKLYVAGGEPTAMPEFYDFLQTCINNQDTSFEFLINTNAVKISDKLLSLTSKFTNLQFIVSIDGYKQANDYSRWGSEWNTVVNNINKIQTNGHKVTFNTTLSLYTIFHYKELLDFLDTQFPGCLIHSQFAENIYPFIFDFPTQLIERLETIRSINAYNNDVLFASFIEGVIKNAKKSKLDKDKLQHFFNFNDTLDISRNSCLNEYIPELENLRKLL